MQRIVTLCTVFICLLTSCAKEKSESAEGAYLEINIQNQMDGAPLQLNTTYRNSFNEDLKISRLKYYISNITLIEGTTATRIADTYFLIDEQNNDSKKIGVSIPPGKWSSLAFLIGVDSTRNVSGAQTGALDPALDMFWTWSTGYIMAKLEGTSSVSTAPDKRFQYHIGGFSGMNNALRVAVLDLPSNLSIDRGKTLHIDLAAEIQNWFDSIHELKIADQPAIMTPGTEAMLFADNYSTMFTATKIEVK